MKWDTVWQAITDVPGVWVGQVADAEALTGCTVLVFPEGAVGGVDIRGSASGTRELNTLDALHVASHIHASLEVAGVLSTTLNLSLTAPLPAWEIA